MALFEFIMVLVSIIVGLGIAEILTGIARLLKNRRVVRYYWVHGALTATVFLILVQQWWEAWGLRESPSWTFVALILMLVGPICLFLIAHLLFPESNDELDIEAYYYGEMRPVWVLAMAAVLGSTAFRPLIMGEALFAPNNATSFLGFCIFAVLFATRHRPVHAVVLPLVFLALVYDVIQWAPVIG